MRYASFFDETWMNLLSGALANGAGGAPSIAFWARARTEAEVVARVRKRKRKILSERFVCELCDCSAFARGGRVSASAD
jgi:hypothetical protein